MALSNSTQVRKGWFYRVLKATTGTSDTFMPSQLTEVMAQGNRQSTSEDSPASVLLLFREHQYSASSIIIARPLSAASAPDP